MPKTRLQACSAQPAEQVTSPRASPPRRVLRSRQGHAGVVVNLGVGGTSVIMALGTPSDYRIEKCRDSRCLTCKNLVLSKIVTSNVTGRTFEAVNFTKKKSGTIHETLFIYVPAYLVTSNMWVKLFNNLMNGLTHIEPQKQAVSMKLDIARTLVMDTISNTKFWKSSLELDTFHLEKSIQRC